MTQYHEPVDELRDEDRNYVRALNSLKEEIEAINWYHQRVAACKDESLKAVLAHNRDEEIEHAVMTIEWLRRNMPGWDEELKTYLFSEGDLTALEEGGESGGSSDLGIGSLKK
jgi:ferritin-like protein